MKITNGVATVALVALLIGECGQPFVDAKELQSVTLQVRAHIDGVSMLKIKNNSLQWKHWTHAAPGLHMCSASSPAGCTSDPRKGCTIEGPEETCHQPTEVTARVVYDDDTRETQTFKWWPRWNYGGDDERRDCNGCQSTKLDMQKTFGFDVGANPEVKFWGWGEGRNCGDSCDAWEHKQVDGMWKKWKGNCCKSNVSKDGTIKIQFYDKDGSSAWYDFSIGLKPVQSGEDDDDNEDEIRTDRGMCTKTRHDALRKYLKTDRFALLDDQVFTGGKDTDRTYTIQDTGGCSCEQILDGLNKRSRNERKYGCKLNTMIKWIEKLRYVEREKLLMSTVHTKPDYASAPFCLGLEDNRIDSSPDVIIRKCNPYNTAQCWNMKYRKTEDVFFRIHPCSDKSLCISAGEIDDDFFLVPCSSSDTGQYFSYGSCLGEDGGKELLTMDGSQKLFLGPPEQEGFTATLEKCVPGEDSSWQTEPFEGSLDVDIAEPVVQYSFGSWSRSGSSSETMEKSRKSRYDMQLMNGAEIGGGYNSLKQDVGSLCPSGRALALDGDRQQYGIVSDHSSLRPKEFTVSAWFRKEGNKDGLQAIVSKSNTEGQTNGFTLIIRNSKDVGLWVGSDNEEYDATANIPEPMGAWHHAVGTFDGSTASLYVDGKLGASFRATLSYGPDPFLVGAYTNRPWNFSGLIEDVILWDYALDADAVELLYRSGSCYNCWTC